MKIFLSFASPERRLAESIQLALLEDNHEVFFDAASLPPGANYRARIRDAISNSDRFVSLISPASLTEGRYVNTELKLAKARWPRPWGYVLAVMAKSTSIKKIDPYLASLTILESAGDIATEVAVAIRQMGPSKSDIKGDWIWKDGGIKFTLTLEINGTFTASSDKGVGPGRVIRKFNGLWDFSVGLLTVNQTHWSIPTPFGEFAKIYPSAWINSSIKSFTKRELRLTDGTRLIRVFRRQ